jgi:hypothetical protein
MRLRGLQVKESADGTLLESWERLRAASVSLPLLHGGLDGGSSKNEHDIFSFHSPASAVRDLAAVRARNPLDTVLSLASRGPRISGLGARISEI